MTGPGMKLQFQGGGLGKATEIPGNPATGLSPKGYGARYSSLVRGTRELERGRLKGILQQCEYMGSSSGGRKEEEVWMDGQEWNQISTWEGGLTTEISELGIWENRNQWDRNVDRKLFLKVAGTLSIV